ncbi:hypothetical protein [Timonella sp. A28]|uniref:hypothetical protein n=1 Tax=Timonella sp. A28 TaxID=3442640 RepID=UPI003EBEAD9C
MLSDAHKPSHEETPDDVESVTDETDPLADLPHVPHHVNKEIFRSSMKALLLLVAVLLIVGSGIGYLVGAMAGVYGALLGVGVTLIFSGTTIWSMIYTADKSPNVSMAVVMGAWVAKMIVFITIMAILGGHDFYHKIIFAVIVLIGVIGSAILDMRAVTKGRLPYVTP